MTRGPELECVFSQLSQINKSYNDVWNRDACCMTLHLLFQFGLLILRVACRTDSDISSADTQGPSAPISREQST